MRVVVLNDGETFTDITNCKVLEFESSDLDDEEIEALVKAVHVSDINILDSPEWPSVTTWEIERLVP